MNHQMYKGFRPAHRQYQALGKNGELVEDGVTGYLLPPEDTSSFADRFLRLYQDRELAMRMGEAGYRKAQAYTVGSVRNEITSVLQGE